MNKVYGIESDYAPVRQDGGRVAICYEKEAVGDGVHYTWYEVYLYKKQTPQLTFKVVHDAIEDDINAQTDKKILTGFEWTLLRGWKIGNNGEKVDLTGQTVKVWLSTENQSNFSEAHNIAKEPPVGFLPVTFKVSEDEAKRAVYEDFASYEELHGFYLQAAAFKNQCLNEGWVRKDSIDWASYEALFPEPEPEPTAEE